MFLTAISLLVLSTGSAVMAMEPVAFDDPRWHIQARESRVVEHLGRESLFLDAGMAWVRGMAFTDGVIEFDLAFTRQRGFMGALWRLQDEQNFEQFYLRPHQSGNPDANQYTPSFYGLTSWQLYHGSGYGTPVDYLYEQWNKVRLVVAGGQAEVFINDMKRPALFISELKHPVQSGKVGLSATFAPAYFSSFRVQAGQPPAFRSEPPAAPVPEKGTIMAFEVSDPFAGKDLDPSAVLTKAFLAKRTWQHLACEGSGLANLGRLHPLSQGRDTVFAKVTLTANSARLMPVEFGYSDAVRVYLNGKPLYQGSNLYRSRDYRYLGTIGFFDQLYLPLEAGENELLFAVSESFGGWGLQVRLP